MCESQAVVVLTLPIAGSVAGCVWSLHLTDLIQSLFIGYLLASQKLLLVKFLLMTILESFLSAPFLQQLVWTMKLHFFLTTDSVKLINKYHNLYAQMQCEKMFSCRHGECELFSSFQLANSCTFPKHATTACLAVLSRSLGLQTV